MTSSPGQSEADPADAAADSGLRCPQCEYNLTGLTENRCPECGAAFDLEELRRILAGQCAPIPGWDDRGDTNILVAFARVCLRVWFQPGEFARRFPAAYDRSSVAGFRWLARAVAVGIFWLTPVILYIAMGGFPGKARHLAPTIAVFYVPIVLGTLFGVNFCEAGIAALLDAAVGRRGLFHPRAATSWSGIVSFHSSFLIITAATAGLAGNVIIAHLGVGAPLADKLLLPLFGVSLLWWWYCLARAVLVRSGPRLIRVIPIALIVVIAMAALALTFLIAGLVGAMLYEAF